MQKERPGISQDLHEGASGGILGAQNGPLGASRALVRAGERPPRAAQDRTGPVQRAPAAPEIQFLTILDDFSSNLCLAKAKRTARSQIEVSRRLRRLRFEDTLGMPLGPGLLALLAFRDFWAWPVTKIKFLIEAAGGTMADIVRVNIFVTNIDQRQEVWRARREFFTGDFPVSTLVEVSALALPEMEVEVEAVAILDAGTG